MPQHRGFERRQILRLMSGGAILTGFNLLPLSPVLAVPAGMVVGDERFGIEFDSAMRTRIVADGKPVTGFVDSERLLLPAGAAALAPMILSSHSRSASRVPGFSGYTQTIVGVSAEGIEKVVDLTFDLARPGFIAVQTHYRNNGTSVIRLRGWRSCDYTLPRHDSGYWTFSGASFPDRRDWIQPAGPGFDQRNYMGMNASDYGGGTPVADIWNRDFGIAAGHLETRPQLVAIPVLATADGASIAIEGDVAQDLAPGATLSTPLCFIALHHGDCFAPLASYREVMVARGLAPSAIPASAYDPIWCAWGYGRNFTVDQVLGTLPKVKEMGLDWVVLDDGWQTSEGDWYLDPVKFPNGDADMKAFVAQVKAAGLRPRLWLAPLAVDPGTDLLRNDTDMLLLDQNGAVNDVTWWNAFTLCPAYRKTIDNCVALVEKIIGDWGFEGLKLDGQHLNAVPPCYNPAHNHARPEESYEGLPEFWQIVHEAATQINPDAVVEFCPCGTSFAYHILPHVNQVPASDPLTSWQVRLKGKVTKALMGPDAPYSGDHVELSDRADDFASTIGVGGVVSTKFTWPRDHENPGTPMPEGGFVLGNKKEAVWRRWIDLYREHRLAEGSYRGALYDIGFDRPEAHTIAKDGHCHFAFFAERFEGTVELRGLSKGRHRITDIVTGENLGILDAAEPRIALSFERHQLLRATPIGRKGA